MPIDDPTVAQQLFQLDTPREVEDFLRRVEGPSIFEDDTRWLNVGNLPSNAGAIEASADEVNPIIERIVNSIESVIELEVERAKYEPSNPSKAIEALFEVPQGSVRLLDESAARRIADRVVVTLRGDRNSPTVIVRDRGIGIHPDAFKDTVVALGRSQKGQKPYLVGMYGQGGSSTFDKCEYTSIVSRRAPDYLETGHDDLLGWTVVRKRLQGRANVYSYLVEPTTKAVPRIAKIAYHSLGFEHGMFIAHVGYRGLGGLATQQITNNGFYTLNYRLFDPLLPWTLNDERGGMGGHTRTMRGVPYRADQLPRVSGIGSTEARRRGEQTTVRHHISYDHRMNSGSTLRVEWWVFQDEQAIEGRRRHNHPSRLEQYRDRTRRYRQRVVAITRGGQTHAALTADLFRSKRLRETARSVIVNVNTDGMTFEEGAGFFASNRADLKIESEQAVEEAIDAAIDLHIDELRAIERERQAELVAGKSASDEAQIRQRLDPLIQAFHRNMIVAGVSPNGPGKQSQEFQGREIPSYLRFARNGPLKIHPGIPSHVDLLTDAADHVVRSPGVHLTPQSDNDGIRVSSPIGQLGRYRLAIMPSAELSLGTRIDLTARLSRPGVFEVATNRSCRLEVVGPPPPWEGNDPPTLLRFKARSGEIHVRQGGARVTLETDARDDFLMAGGRVDARSPIDDKLPVVGVSGPSGGEIRINLQIPEDYPLGPAGELSVTMSLANGTKLSDIATLVINERSGTGGTTTQTPVPSYRIHDVQEIKADEDEVSWADMPAILGNDDAWTAEDVAAFYIEELDSDREIHFYLNVDNRLLKQAEERVAHRRSESGVDALREFQRTVLCGHLYSIASSRDLPPENSSRGKESPPGKIGHGRRTDGTEEVHRGADHCGPERGGGGGQDRGVMPQARDERRHLLQVESQVRWADVERVEEAEVP